MSHTTDSGTNTGGGTADSTRWQILMTRVFILFILMVVFMTACSEPGPATGAPGSSAGEETRRIPVGAEPGSKDGVARTQPSTDASSPSRWSVAHALAKGPRCGMDEVVHRVQGQPKRQPGSSDAICPDSPSKLDPSFDVSPSALFFFDLSTEYEAEVARRGYPGFVLEGSMHGVGPPNSPRLQSVYVGCTKLQVAGEGVPTLGTESCLGPLTGGTSHPAPKAADCPSAVKIAGSYRPFTRKRQEGAHGDGGPAACCYAIPAPVPP